VTKRVERGAFRDGGKTVAKVKINYTYSVTACGDLQK
jgi:hypothetical protein